MRVEEGSIVEGSLMGGGPEFLSWRRGIKMDGQRIRSDASFGRKGRTA
jgi:hypothetical protein